MAGKIKLITEGGRQGKVQYKEGWWKPNTCSFYWEFGAGDMIVTVWFPEEEKWDQSIPWAKARQKEIMTTIAEQLRRQQAPNSNIQWEADRFHLMKK